MCVCVGNNAWPLIETMDNGARMQAVRADNGQDVVVVATVFAI